LDLHAKNGGAEPLGDAHLEVASQGGGRYDHQHGALQERGVVADKRAEVLEQTLL
jgi:hypothetical protein